MDVLHLDKRLSPLLNGLRITPGILSYLRAGAGFGGSCLPKDLNTLRMFARMRKIPTPLLDATLQVNDQRPRQVGALVELALAGLDGRTLALLGLGFKPGTDDLRDSPALTILRYLLDRGAIVRAYDPLASAKAKSLFDSQVTFCDTPEEALTDVDGAVIATALEEFAGWNWHRLCGRMRRAVIIDGRNALRHVSLPAQVIYWPVGVSKRGDVETGHER
jgi:UDPglucose 6-dehydrogenase/GDP-mannose 6-dehydrogenase